MVERTNETGTITHPGGASVRQRYIPPGDRRDGRALFTSGTGGSLWWDPDIGSESQNISVKISKGRTCAFEPSRGTGLAKDRRANNSTHERSLFCLASAAQI